MDENVTCLHFNSLQSDVEANHKHIFIGTETGDVQLFDIDTKQIVSNLIIPNCIED